MQVIYFSKPYTTLHFQKFWSWKYLYWWKSNAQHPHYYSFMKLYWWHKIWNSPKLEKFFVVMNWKCILCHCEYIIRHHYTSKFPLQATGYTLSFLLNSIWESSCWNTLLNYRKSKHLHKIKKWYDTLKKIILSKYSIKSLMTKIKNSPSSGCICIN